MYDLFFLSYQEPLSDENWFKLKNRFVHARRISGIKGIDAAHKKAAQQSNTTMFYTVDADTVVDCSWKFDYVPPEWDRKFLHLWYSRNPVNNLEYGYAGIKLWPKESVLNFQSPWLDFTTGVGNIKIMPNVISTTYFNTSKYESWKSVFREVIKLYKNVEQNENDQDSKLRLQVWLTVFNDVNWSEWCKQGANDAKRYFEANKSLSIINDFEKLEYLFRELYPTEII